MQQGKNSTYPGIGHPPIRSHERSRTKVFVLVPPVTRARSRTTCTENALVHPKRIKCQDWKEIGKMEIEGNKLTHQASFGPPAIEGVHCQREGYHSSSKAQWTCIACRTMSNLGQGPSQCTLTRQNISLTHFLGQV